MFQVCRLVSSRLAPATGKKEWPCLSLPRLAAASAGHACESCVTAQTLDNSHIHILFIFTLHLQYTFNRRGQRIHLRTFTFSTAYIIRASDHYTTPSTDNTHTSISRHILVVPFVPPTHTSIMSTDLDQLVDMGFDREKSEMALKKSGNLPSAIDWLDKNSEKTMEDLNEETAAAAGDAENPGQQAMSMVCNDCGRKLRNMAAAQFHAEKTGHDDFSESTEEIAPLTAEEKKQKLQELKEKLAEKRAGQASEDVVTRKRNEQINKKHTRETEDVKEELRKKEQIKEARERQNRSRPRSAATKDRARESHAREPRRLQPRRTHHLLRRRRICTENNHQPLRSAPTTTNARRQRNEDFPSLDDAFRGCACIGSARGYGAAG